MVAVFLVSDEELTNNVSAFQQHSSTVRDGSHQDIHLVSSEDNIVQVLTVALSDKIPSAPADNVLEVFRDPKLHVHVLSTLVSMAMVSASYSPCLFQTPKDEALAFEKFNNMLRRLFPGYLFVSDMKYADLGGTGSGRTNKQQDRGQGRDFVSIVYAFEGGASPAPSLTIHYRKLAMHKTGFARKSAMSFTVYLNGALVMEESEALARQGVKIIHAEHLVDYINLFLHYVQK